MSETIKLMRAHTSVRRFTEEKISADTLKTIIEAGRAASSWKNFQSYSIVVAQSEEKKQALFDLLPQKALLQASAVLLFVGDLNRAETAVSMHGADFDGKGPENLLISSVDAALAGQNTLLAAESLGYGGVFIGMIRQVGDQVAELFNLPDYTYPVFCIALGKPLYTNEVKPRLPYEAVVFDEEYKVQGEDVIKAYDAVQTDYAGSRQTELWSERLVAQFGQAEQPETKLLLEKKKLY